MELGEVLAALLPPPRPDDPAGLRQDILDELADHLTCSYHRELLRGLNAGDAQARAIEQFGDPAAVARRLWLDAMKGKIMAKRIFLATCLLVTCASLALAGAFWFRSMQASRALAAALAHAEYQRAMAEQALAESQLRMAESLAQNKATNAEILKQMETVAKAAQSSATSQWIPLSFKLTEESLDGPPAVGCEVEVNGRLERVSDSTGIVDLGVVQPGYRYFRITRPWNEDQLCWQLSDSISILPDSKVVKSIICPKAPPQRLSLRINVDWPPDLADKDLCVYAELDGGGISYQPPVRWLPFSMRDGKLPAKRILSGPGTRQTAVAAHDSLQFWKVAGQQVERYERNPDQTYATLKNASKTASARDVIETEPGSYSVLSLTVLRHRPRDDVEPVRGEAFELVARARRYPDTPEPVDHWANIFGDNSQSQYVPLDTIDVPKSYWGSLEKTVKGKPGEIEEWTIALPDALTTAARAKLKPKPAAKPKDPAAAPVPAAPAAAPRP